MRDPNANVWEFVVKLGLAAADEIARESLRSAEQHGDAASMVTGHRLVGNISGQLGRWPSAHADEALAHYDPARDWTSRFVYTPDLRAMCLIWLSHALLVLNYREQARTRVGDTLAQARDLAHPLPSPRSEVAPFV